MDKFYEKGWANLKHPARFGEDHMYFHENFLNMRIMDHVHLEDANTLSEYVTCVERANPHQATHLDM